MPTTSAENADINALDALDCDAEPSTMGGGPPLSVESGGDSADAALAALLSDDYTMPRTGYVEEASDPDEVLYVYRAADRVKTAVVVTNVRSAGQADPWIADELRACDWQEFGAEADLGPGYSPWVQPGGRVLWASQGPSHCDLQTVTFLHSGARQYARDPEGVIGSENLVKPYDDDASLPDDAIDTTYRKGNRELWSVPDRSALYSVGPSRTELWPRTKNVVGCA